MSDSVFLPPYCYHATVHGPVTIYDAIEVAWIGRVKETLPHKVALAAAMVDGLNRAAVAEQDRAATVRLYGEARVVELEREANRG